jgi:ferredoxin
MKTLTLQPINKTISVKTDTKVLDTLLDSQCEVAMACGGMGLCATCHVFVIKGEESLTPPHRTGDSHAGDHHWRYGAFTALLPGAHHW